jgi:hypothetical protein
LTAIKHNLELATMKTEKVDHPGDMRRLGAMELAGTLQWHLDRQQPTVGGGW